MSPGIARILVLSGVITIFVGIVLTIALGVVWPLLVVVVGVSDIAIAALLGKGVLTQSGSGSGEPPPAPPIAGTAAEVADGGEYGTLSDGTRIKAESNPFARED